MPARAAGRPRYPPSMSGGRSQQLPPQPCARPPTGPPPTGTAAPPACLSLLGRTTSPQGSSHRRPSPARPTARGPRCSPSAAPLSAPGPNCYPRRRSAPLPPLAAARPRGPAANQRAFRRCGRRARRMGSSRPGQLPIPGCKIPGAPGVPERPCPARAAPRGLFSGRPFLGASVALGACRPRPKGPGVRWWALPGERGRLCSP